MFRLNNLISVLYMTCTSWNNNVLAHQQLLQLRGIILVIFTSLTQCIYYFTWEELL